MNRFIRVAIVCGSIPRASCVSCIVVSLFDVLIVRFVWLICVAYCLCLLCACVRPIRRGRGMLSRDAICVCVCARLA